MKRTRMKPLVPLALSVPLLVLATVSQPGQTEPPAPAAKEPLTMKPEQASAFARLALKGMRKEYPNKPADVLNGEADVKAPRALHPAFYGCFDWHSSVHGHWMLVRLLRLFPDLPEQKEIRAVLAENLTAKNLQAEADYFTPAEPPVVRADLRLGLAAEAGRGTARLGRRRRPASGRGTCSRWPTRSWLATSPSSPSRPTRSAAASIRTRRSGWPSPSTTPGPSDNKPLRELIEERSRAYFGKDASIPAAWEPDGADFFSPSLMEADLMRRVLPPAEFRAWLQRFLPDLAKGEPKNAAGAGDGDGPHRSAARPPGRPEPEPGLVHAEHRRRAAEGRPGAQGAGRVGRAPRRGGPARTSPAATTPASTGWLRSPSTCSRRRRRIEAAGS